jgi:sulfur carrier protein ThiS
MRVANVLTDTDYWRPAVNAGGRWALAVAVDALLAREGDATAARAAAARGVPLVTYAGVGRPARGPKGELVLRGSAPAVEVAASPFAGGVACVDPPGPWVDRALAELDRVAVVRSFGGGSAAHYLGALPAAVARGTVLAADLLVTADEDLACLAWAGGVPVLYPFAPFVPGTESGHCPDAARAADVLKGLTHDPDGVAAAMTRHTRSARLEEVLSLA